MIFYRIKITSWTASFRYPNLISGYQASLPVPPLSTIYGLMSAVAGFNITSLSPEIGFVFQSWGKATDVETIYQMQDPAKGSSLKTTSNVVRREILVDNTLWLYLRDKKIADFFQNPYFQVLLGRSQDLASIEEICQIELEKKDTLDNLKGTVVPFSVGKLPAPICPLPHHFSDSFPRRNIGTQPYLVLAPDYRQKSTLSTPGWLDPERKVDIFWHTWNLNEES